MCLRDPKATPNIWLSNDYNITFIVKFPSKFWYFNLVSVKADFHPIITIHSLEFAFLQRITRDNSHQKSGQISPKGPPSKKKCSHGSHITCGTYHLGWPGAWYFKLHSGLFTQTWCTLNCVLDHLFRHGHLKLCPELFIQTWCTLNCALDCLCRPGISWVVPWIVWLRPDTSWAMLWAVCFDLVYLEVCPGLLDSDLVHLTLCFGLSFGPGISWAVPWTVWLRPGTCKECSRLFDSDQVYDAYYILQVFWLLWIWYTIRESWTVPITLGAMHQSRLCGLDHVWHYIADSGALIMKFILLSRTSWILALMLALLLVLHDIDTSP
jgi:hypothetical protein